VPGTEVLFCIHEVRFRDYEEYAKKAKETVDGSWKIQTKDGVEIKRNGGAHPATWVSWDDAQRFCAWLGEKESLRYRLPTDREWSLAVGLGGVEAWNADTTPETVNKPKDLFPWGTEWPPPAGAGNFSDESRKEKAPRDDAKYVEGGYNDGFPTTAPVMSFAANEFGLFDLAGNVEEWCEDFFSEGKTDRDMRGGCWHYGERGLLLSSVRQRVAPDFRGSNRGFRIVVVTSPRS
jgi:formylglycine-generating enzyme required for sulfatase activity